MTIDESTERIQLIDLEDLDATTQAVADRGRAVVQFAAYADRRSLQTAQAAGQVMIEQLLEERCRLLTELRNTRALHDCLASNRSEDSMPASFLGASLLA